MAEKEKIEKGNAVDLLLDAMANIKANAPKDGLTPQQERALQKIQTACQMLTGTQTKKKPSRVE